MKWYPIGGGYWTSNPELAVRLNPDADRRPSCSCAETPHHWGCSIVSWEQSMRRQALERMGDHAD